jgi:hypothetical protein
MESSNLYDLIQIITEGKPGLYRVVEPPCSLDKKAYRKWVGFTIEKHDFTKAITIVDPAGTMETKGTCLPLTGFALRSVYERVLY